MCQELLSLEVAAAPEQVGQVRRRVAEHLRGLAFSDDDVASVILAVGEACNNAVSYGTAAAPDPTVCVTCRLTDSNLLQVDIKNQGNHFYPDVAALALLPDPDEFATHGRGFALMQALVDDVQVLSDGHNTTVRLTKQRS